MYAFIYPSVHLSTVFVLVFLFWRPASWNQETRDEMCEMSMDEIMKLSGERFEECLQGNVFFDNHRKDTLEFSSWNRWNMLEPWRIWGKHHIILETRFYQFGGVLRKSTWTILPTCRVSLLSPDRVGWCTILLEKTKKHTFWSGQGCNSYSLHREQTFGQQPKGLLCRVALILSFCESLSPKKRIYILYYTFVFWPYGQVFNSKASMFVPSVCTPEKRNWRSITKLVLFSVRTGVLEKLLLQSACFFTARSSQVCFWPGAKLLLNTFELWTVFFWILLWQPHVQFHFHPHAPQKTADVAARNGSLRSDFPGLIPLCPWFGSPRIPQTWLEVPMLFLDFPQCEAPQS